MINSVIKGTLISVACMIVAIIGGTYAFVSVSTGSLFGVIAGGILALGGLVGRTILAFYESRIEKENSEIEVNDYVSTKYDTKDKDYSIEEVKETILPKKDKNSLLEK